MIYVMGQQNKQWKSLPVKIGYSGDPNKRLKEIQTGNPYRLCIRKTICATQKEERETHRVLREFKTNGEWFIFDDYAVGILDEILRSSTHLDLTKLSLTVEKVMAKKKVKKKAIDEALELEKEKFDSWVDEYTLSQQDRDALSRVYRQMGITSQCQSPYPITPNTPCPPTPPSTSQTS